MLSHRILQHLVGLVGMGELHSAGMLLQGFLQAQQGDAMLERPGE
jgi:hypothetical protein